MVKRILPLVVVWIVAVAFTAGDAQVRSGGSAPPAPQRAAAPAPQVTRSQPAGVDAAFLKQYCITCHNERTKANFGGLAIDSLDATRIDTHAEKWEKIVRKIKTGMMPPSGAPRPSRDVLDAFAASLETKLDAAADPKASLETPALHRLNRVEYGNAIRDLLDIDVNVASLLPADGSSEGFDNIAEMLGVSPSLIQGYVSAAMKISRLAVGDRTMAPSLVTYQAPAGLAQDRHLDGLPLGTRGGLVVRHIFPLDAEYEFTIGGGRGGGPGGGTDVTFDGQKLTAQNPGRFRAANNGFATGGGVQGINIMGPFNPTGPGDTPSRRRIFVCRPAAAAEEEACAKNILTTVARRAYRGTVSGADLDTLMTFYRQGRAAGDFETGIQVALARVLVAPRFIYRVEEEPANVAAGGVYRISDLELASRLSFFLWSSIPDNELLELASKGRLRDAATLQRQVTRMLADPKADALIENFAGQWLYLRELANVQTEAPGFDDNLRQAFRRETEMLFGTIVREDRPIVELLDSDYTFVDERLARHYGMNNIRGSHFRRVTLDPASPRRGLLGHGSMLTVTSVATRTSPVMRGKWILENLLGAPPPEPPPGVETNLDQPEAAKTTTLRQRLELHRASPVCATCHNIMDPLGLALENFDLIGAWRDTDGPSKVDSSGRLADGTPVSGSADLRRAMLSRSDAFVTTATEKLMTYALGRPVHHYDMSMVRGVVRRAGRDGNRFSALVLGIVESDAFQKRIKK